MTEPTPNRRWIWFFALVTLLALAGVTIPIVYNLRQQLTRAQLQDAMDRWDEKGPKSYNLRYVVKKSNTEPEVFTSEVRAGKVIAAALNGRPLDEPQRRYRDMRHLFSDMQQFLNCDLEPGKPRPFATAHFDATTGHLLRYVRAVRGTRERVEIDVQVMKPVAD